MCAKTSLLHNLHKEFQQITYSYKLQWDIYNKHKFTTKE